MGRVDWDRIHAADPATLTDDDIEDLYPTIISCDVEEINDIHNLQIMMKLSQEILQFKDNQVESLLLECGELKETISSLKPEPVKRKMKERESTDKKVDGLSVSQDIAQTMDHDDVVQEKNKKIKILMAELETFEKDNLILKEKLTSLSQEMQDATQKMNDMVEELNSFQAKSIEYQEKISILERENAALLAQIEEVTAQQMDRDNVIDEFGAAIDARINEWKAILDEKDAEIIRLKEHLSQSFVHSAESAREQSKNEIVRLNEEIDRRDKLINELKTKLSEATIEINEGATLIEKLKDAQKLSKSDRKKEHKSLLKKLQETNEQISQLRVKLNEAEEDIQMKNTKLTEVLSTLKRYENENEGLTEALNEIKELRMELQDKNENVTNITDMVNKLEALNSYQEMEIITLREKLGIPEDESIPIDDILAKRKEQERKMQELIRQNKTLIEENIDLKSDIRVLKYKLNSKEFDFLETAVDESMEFFHSTKLADSTYKLQSKINVSELRENMRLVIEENEALRTGMHEILDSIRNQDGKSTVEIQSNTLERLLEALDVRHLAGWYHPAMRLQEHLNVVQGSNAELRGQLKQLRKEVQRKDKILQTLALNEHGELDKMCNEESEGERSSLTLSETKNLQEAYKNEASEWEKQRSFLTEQNEELKSETEKLKLQLQIYRDGSKVLESDEDEMRKAFAIKTKEFAEISGEALTANRKVAALRRSLSKETARSYNERKEAIRNENYLKSTLAESGKRNKILEREISTLRNNLCNSISRTVHNDLKEKHEELNIRFRNLLENNLTLENDNLVEYLRNELELMKREKDELVQHFRKENLMEEEKNLMERLKEAQTNEILEKQRADHVTNLHEISQTQLSKCEECLKEMTVAKSELQEELIILHKRLSKDLHFEKVNNLDDNKLQELNNQNATLEIEIESLRKRLEIAKDEAEQQYSLNSLKTMELDSLGHQILNLQAISEDKATIARLNAELASKTLSEMELSTRKVQLESQVTSLQEELDKSKTTCDGLRTYAQDSRKQCENRCRIYVDVITFLKNQYAGSTSISALDRIAGLTMKLKRERENVNSEMKKAHECLETAKQQQETLSNRLQIVESLKDILEQQIGSNNVEDIVKRFSEYSQYTLNDFKYKRKITQLEYDLQIANNKFMEYESLITEMEQDMIRIQKTWSRGQDRPFKIDTRDTGTSPELLENKHSFAQASVETRNKEIQTDPYTCCLEKKETREAEIQTAKETDADDCNFKGESPEPIRDVPREEMKVDRKEETIYSKEETECTEKAEKENRRNNDTRRQISLLREQLNEALKLASERSSKLMKYELELAEHRSKVDALNEVIESKDLQLSRKERSLEEWKLSSRLQPSANDCGDKLALKSTVNSLQQLLGQKEETITRYRNLLKEDRDEHGKAAARLQEEIKNLHGRLQALQNQSPRGRKRNEVIRVEPEKLIEEVEDAEMRIDSTRRTAMRIEEVARLREKVSTLEADLSIAKELSDRWHRLAEERLKHMDRMRERSEEEHKNELESYRGELTKWQTEADTLRKQLSENRMMLTKGNISLMKELQDRDDKINQLSLTCQQLQNELELMETRSHRAITYGDSESKIHEITQTLNCDNLQQHSHMDAMKKQLQSLLEKEKMYKNEISELKQQIGRRYMAVKTQEKKTSQRESQLERKVKSLEEELEKAHVELNREHLANEAKKAKTAEELALWEKQKKWQQVAEKLKEKLKEKTDECAKLVSNYEKLRSVISCMEREKWYLKSKLKFENNAMIGSLSARPATSSGPNIMEELQKDCQILRERIKELTDRLENEDNEKLLMKIEEQKNRISALEAVSQGDSNVVAQLEKLEMTKDILEKMNLALEAENFELRLELEKTMTDLPRSREKIQHLEKYIELLKAEKSSETSPRLLDKCLLNTGPKKSISEMEKTIFTLKRIIEKLQMENKRLKLASKRNLNHQIENKLPNNEEENKWKNRYEEARKRIVALETDLQLAEQRITALEMVQEEENDGEINLLKEQLNQKTELLDKVKHLLSRAAANEKILRQRVHQLESKQTLSTVPECCVSSPTLE